MPRSPLTSAGLEDRLQRAWETRTSPMACALLPLAGLYLGLTTIHRLLYRWGIRTPRNLPVPVIVVGNVIAGGAGKTPVVLALVDHLKQMGLAPGVIARGHGRQRSGILEVRADSTPLQVGDEPWLVARRSGVPVFVGERRVDAGHALLARHPSVQVLISDDGLQHADLARDLEVCVFDERGLGNGWPLPAGPLRERWPRPVDLILQSASGRPIPDLPAPAFPVERQLADHAHRADGTQITLEALARSPDLVAVAGIARPAAFFDMLRAAGCKLQATQAFADHHPYLTAPALPATATVVCTEKDAAKLWRHRPDAWAIPLTLRAPPGFWSALEGRLRAGLSSSDGSQTA